MPIPNSLLPTLKALLGRLVPSDRDPGALELGAEDFIQERLRENPDLLVVYERGLSALLEQNFHQLAPEAQDELLLNFEKRYPEFMPVVCAHAVEAVYTHREGLRMVGFEVTV